MIIDYKEKSVRNMKYNRLTRQKWSENIDLKKEFGDSTIYKALYDLENKIENGELVESNSNPENVSQDKNDPVNHPSHYTDGKIEVIDFILDKKLNFTRGNAVKYISRAGKKNPETEIEDLQKAAWYINKEIQRLQGDKS